MIGFGSTEIAKAYLGGTEISKMYLGEELVFGGGSPTPVVPYDAEVEYLEGSGTQWILLDAQSFTTYDTKIEYKARHTSSSGNQVVFSYGSVSAKTNFTVWEYNNGYYASTLGKEANRTSATTTSDHIIIMQRTSTNAGKFYINGTSSNISGTFASSSNVNCSVFGNPVGGSIYKGRIYYLKIWQDGILLLDLIPVRVGQIGYMYDTVSGELFGSSGTGSFTYGNDITT